MRRSLKQAIITAAIMIVVIAATSCTVTRTPDGTVTRQYDANPWLEIASFYFSEPTPAVAPIVLEDGK